jgi:apoptosis-inducing factor 2
MHQLPCRGPKPYKNFVTLVPGTLSETNHIRVSSTMQVFNYPRIFAGGDAIEWDEQKQVTKYGAHASVIVENIVALLQKKQPSALYSGSYELISISNGRISAEVHSSTCVVELSILFSTMGQHISKSSGARRLGPGYLRL